VRIGLKDLVFNISRIESLRCVSYMPWFGDGRDALKAQMAKRWKEESISVKSHILDFDTEGVLGI
jgi:hypothetical protein